MPQAFNTLVDEYRSALELWERSDPSVSWPEILAVLMLRDRLQETLATQDEVNLEHLVQLVDLDSRLKAQQGEIAAHPEYETYRQLLNPSETAWWWFFQVPEPKKWWSEIRLAVQRGDFGGTNHCCQPDHGYGDPFIHGGVDLGATLAVSGQSVLALLAGGGALTQAGRKAYGRVLESLKVDKRHWQETSFGLAVVLTLGLGGVHAALPHLAQWVNRGGEVHYRLGQLDSARKDFQRAVALKPDYGKAHFNLGLVYEDLQQVDQAKVEYQLVVTQLIADCNPQVAKNCGVLTWLQAHNNLARLNILAQDYGVAVPLLQAGLRKLQEPMVESNPNAKHLKYDLLKNLGWARLNQEFYSEAENLLLEAIDAEAQPDAFCLMAQLNESQKDETMALENWEQCLVLANQDPSVLETQSEVNQWAATAQERLSASAD